MRVFEVKDADGSHLGILYVDYYPRPNKEGGAWMSNYREQSVRNGVDIRPVIVNNGNFSKPTAGEPALISFEEATTLFHEFGHALHGLLTKCTYESLSGTNVRRDFVELCSQIMENWATDPEVLKMYARHYKTGEPIPDALIEKIEKSRFFNQGFETVEYVAACFLDMDWHTLTEPREIDPLKFEAARHGPDRPHPGDRQPLPDDLFQPHLQRRLLGRLLQLHLGRRPRLRRLRGLQGDEPLRPGDGPVLPDEHPGEGRQRGPDGPLQALPRPRAQDRAAAQEAGLD